MKIHRYKYVIAILMLAFAGCEGPAVKRGQTNVPTSLLPLACLTIGVNGGGWPLENIVFENVDTHRTKTFIFNKSFDRSHPDYPTAVEHGSKVLCMAIVHLDPGNYIIRRIEFSPPTFGGVATTELEFDLEHGYRFKVAPDAANYLGTLSVTPNWHAVDSLLTPSREDRRGQFSAQFFLEATQLRDKDWAADVIPGMAALPFVSGELQAF